MKSILAALAVLAIIGLVSAPFGLVAQHPKYPVTPAGGAGDDLGSATAADVVALWASGSCSGFMKNDGTCSTPAAGHATTYDTYANLPATCTTGARHFTSDSIYEFLCTATNTWTALYKGQVVTIPPSTGWGTDGSATITASHTKGYIYMTIPANGSPNVGLYHRDIPAAPYTVTALIRVNAAASDFYHGALAIAQVSTDEQQYIGLLCEGGNRIGSHFWGTFTGSVSTIGTMRPWFDNEIWVRIADNSTNRILSWSMDGINWVQHSSETNTTNLTPDKIGFQMNSQNSQIVTMMAISYKTE